MSNLPCPNIGPNHYTATGNVHGWLILSCSCQNNQVYLPFFQSFPHSLPKMQGRTPLFFSGGPRSRAAKPQRFGTTRQLEGVATVC